MKQLRELGRGSAWRLRGLLVALHNSLTGGDSWGGQALGTGTGGEGMAQGARGGSGWTAAGISPLEGAAQGDLESPSLEVSKESLDVALSTLGW